MPRSDPPDAVEREMIWRFQGGTPHDVEVARSVTWDQQIYPHPSLVAVVNLQDRAYATYFRSREEVERFIRKLHEAVEQAWPA